MTKITLLAAVTVLTLTGCTEPYHTHDRELGRIMAYIQKSNSFNQSPLSLNNECKGAIEDVWQNLDSWKIVRRAYVRQTSNYEIEMQSKTGKTVKMTSVLYNSDGLIFRCWPTK